MIFRQSSYVHYVFEVLMSNGTSFVSFLRNKCQSSFYNIDFDHFLREL